MYSLFRSLVGLKDYDSAANPEEVPFLFTTLASEGSEHMRQIADDATFLGTVSSPI